MKFLCPSCTKTSEEFNYAKSLKRITDAVDKKLAAKREQLLLQTYVTEVQPEIVAATVAADPTAKQLLLKYQPGMLEKFVPRESTGDGNCCYRAVSSALYGTDKLISNILFQVWHPSRIKTNSTNTSQNFPHLLSAVSIPHSSTT